MVNQSRPPVLAHDRFLADRENFQGLDLIERFERIARTNLWGANTSKSGLGSELVAATSITCALPALFTRINARSILDAPCGEFGWIQQAVRGLDYVGIDIVEGLIVENRARVERCELAGRFFNADITRDRLPRADVILCRDCLVHLSYKNILRSIDQFKASGSTWLLTTTFPLFETNADCEDEDWRASNFERPPFNWVPPNELLNEQCTEGNGGWADKSLGLWRLGSLPTL